jgi:hypothetical protein
MASALRCVREPARQAPARCPRHNHRLRRPAARRRRQPSRYEPEDLFRHRPNVSRVMSMEQMDEAIASAVSHFESAPVVSWWTTSML